MKKPIKTSKRANLTGKPNDGFSDSVEDDESKAASSKTRLARLANGNIKVFHSQSLKRNYNYNSAETSYGLEVEVEPENVQKALKLMEKQVEALLMPKSSKQLDFLVRNAS